MVLAQYDRKMYESLVGRTFRLRRMKHLSVSTDGRELYGSVHEAAVHINLPAGTKGTIIKVVLSPKPRTYVQFVLSDDLELSCWIEKEFLEVLSENRGDQ